MSLSLKFDKLKAHDGQPDNKGKENDETDIQLHSSANNVRNVCFVQPDNSQIFLNYAYLVSGKFEPDKNLITLTFTSHTVTIKGHNMAALYEQLMDHQPKRIESLEKRYEGTKSETDVYVTEVIVKSQKN